MLIEAHALAVAIGDLPDAEAHRFETRMVLVPDPTGGFRPVWFESPLLEEYVSGIPVHRWYWRSDVNADNKP